MKILSTADKTVLIELLFRSNGSYECWPHINDLATALSLSRRQVSRSLAKLKKHVIIEIEPSTHFANKYRINDLEWILDTLNDPMPPSNTSMPPSGQPMT